MALSGLHTFTARISFFAMGERYSLRRAKRCIPKTLVRHEVAFFQ